MFLLPCQVNVKIFHHTISSPDDGSPATITPDKPLCFLLDELKDPEEKTKGKKTKKKKDKDNQPTVKNFGSRLNINKLKGVSKLIIGWRIRPVLGVGSLHSILLNAGCTPMCCHTILTILYICPAFVHGPSEAGYRGRQQISDADSPYLLPRWRAGS